MSETGPQQCGGLHTICATRLHNGARAVLRDAEVAVAAKQEQLAG